MTELYRSEFLTVTTESAVLELRWSKQEPADYYAVVTAKAVVATLDQHFASYPGPPLRVLVDVSAISRPYPRGTACYARWLVDNRQRIQIRAVGIVATSFLVRTALTAAVLVPGLKIKSFSDRGEALAYLDAG